MNRISAEMFSSLQRLQNTRIKPPPIGGLHSNEIGILLFLKHGGKPGRTISELSHIFGVTRSSITQQVNQLQALGYVNKQTVEEDRRSVTVKITIKGAGLVMQMDRRRQNNLEQLVQFLGESDSKELIRIINRIAEYNTTNQE